MNKIKKWRDINWPLVEKRNRRLKKRIFKASLNGEQAKMRNLQKRLIRSLDAKLLAVKRVCLSSVSRKTAGVDGIKNLSPENRLKLVSDLKMSGRASPIRKIYISKLGKVYSMGIPTVYDRALQQLALYALEPEWEARFEPNSYGFRPGRLCQDAVRAIYNNMRGKAVYVLDADLRNCFDRINYEKLIEKLNTFSLMKKQIRAWLESGILNHYIGEIQSNRFGTSQVGEISLLLVNIALHGIETFVKNFYVNCLYDGPSKIGKRDRYSQIGLVRYGDDFVVMHPNELIIGKIKERLNFWLRSNIGLEFSEENNKIKVSFEGFKFLGHHIITLKKKNGLFKCKIHIDSSSKRSLLEKTRYIFQSNKSASAGNLIFMLNSIILDWCDYFCYCECSRDFKQVEYRIFQQLKTWVFRRKSKNLRSKTKLKNKYFPEKTSVTFRGKIHTGNWIFVGKVPKNKRYSKKKVFLVYPSWIISSMWVKVRGTASIYNSDQLYWVRRNFRYGGLPTRVCKLMKKQKLKCPICGEFFDIGSHIEIDHIVPVANGGPDIYENLQAVHDHCHRNKTRFDLVSIRERKIRSK